MDNEEFKTRLKDHMNENDNQSMNFPNDYPRQSTYSDCNGSCAGNCVASNGEPPEPPRQLHRRMVHIGPISFNQWRED